jgi:plastocyanin
MNSAAVILAGTFWLFASAHAPAPRVVTITVDRLAFAQAPEGLHVGDTVVWLNKDLFVHSATDSAKGFDVELPPGGRGRIALRRPGVIFYYCRYHPDMKGHLTVGR